VGVLLLLGVRFDATCAATAAASLLAAAAILAGAPLVTKSQARAERLGRGVGRVAAPVRRSIDPDRWAASFADFQGHIANRFRPGLALSAPTLIGQLLVDAAVV
jgi:hypothetical protein